MSEDQHTEDISIERFAVDDHMLYGGLKTSVPASETWSWSEPCMMGIDEAGRGPVLGPMVYAACIAPVSQIDQVKKMGFNDSKVLKEEVRDKLFEDIKACSNVSWLVDPIRPTELSNKMLRGTKENLNTISHTSAINLVRLFIAKGYNIQELYVDTIGPAHVYQDKLKSVFPNIGKIVVASKADALYPIVSAASICAKVTRDTMLKTWTHEEKGIEVSAQTGSGYPGDENTKKWLRAHVDPVFGFPQLVRFSWSTAQEVMNELCKPVSWVGDDQPIIKKRQPAAILTNTKRRGALRKRNHLYYINKSPFENK